MQQPNPDQFGRVSQLCVMSGAEHPPITAGVIIIPEASKSKGERGDRGGGGGGWERGLEWCAEL